MGKTPDSSSDSQQGAQGAAASAPRIRLNSSKVSQFPESSDNLVDISENSRFALWRQRQASQWGSEPTVEAVPAPVALGTRRRQRRRSWKRWAYGLGAGLLAALIFVGLVFYSPLLATRTVTVQGASLLDQEAAEQQLAQLEGIPLSRITEGEVARLLGHENLLYGVSLQARPPHELVVLVHERVPLAVVEHEGSYILVDDEGVQLGTAASVEEAGVPLVNGGLEVLGAPVFSTVTGVLAALPTSILSQVQEAKADSASTIVLEMTDGTEVVWGTPEDSELKAKVLVQLREAMGGAGAVATYDVSSPLVPTVK